MRTFHWVSSTCFSAFILASATGCSSDPASDAEPFDTFQMCYDDHHGAEALPVDKAIGICCIDHPIGTAAANTVCGATAAACESYVTANLVDAADATLAADIQAACASYVVDRAK